MKAIANQPALIHGLLILLALAYAAGLLNLSGHFQRQPGVAVSYHLRQAQALLEGHLRLANSLADLRPGLVWHNGEVQQVWGLGVALWLLPFQALWRLAGGQSFPDQISLGVAFALLALYAGRTGLRWVQRGKTVFGLGFIWIILLNPPLWTLVRNSQLVFEETVLYGLLLALGILVAVVRVAVFDSQRDFWLCCVLAALSGLVRPTLLVYGFGGMFTCCLMAHFRSRPLKSMLPGVCLFICGLAMLALTNLERFGSPLEFGHRLTVSSQSMVYLTRFSNPFQEASNLAAAKELGGLLFLSPPIQDHAAFAESWFQGQAPDIRWRRLDQSTFDLSYLAIMILALSWPLWRLFRRPKVSSDPAELFLQRGLLAWPAMAFAALFLFYLHYPTIASRYLLDFLPAMAGFALAAWFWTSSRLRGLPILVLAGWLIYEFATSQVNQVSNQTEAAFPSSAKPPSTSLLPFAGTYSSAHHPSQTGLWFNGSGWDQESGIAEDIVILAVDQPQFIELNHHAA
jgi:hypothetical protein